MDKCYAPRLRSGPTTGHESLDAGRWPLLGGIRRRLGSQYITASVWQSKPAAGHEPFEVAQGLRQAALGRRVEWLPGPVVNTNQNRSKRPFSEGEYPADLLQRLTGEANRDVCCARWALSICFICFICLHRPAPSVTPKILPAKLRKRNPTFVEISPDRAWQQSAAPVQAATRGFTSWLSCRPVSCSSFQRSKATCRFSQFLGSTQK